MVVMNNDVTWRCSCSHHEKH